MNARGAAIQAARDARRAKWARIARAAAEESTRDGIAAVVARSLQVEAFSER